ncbi:MAG: D-alanine--D-alanine ligase family protein [Legionellaceae bacterium]
MAGLAHVVLLYGGRSGEHEISLRSAASVLAHLDRKKYKVTPVGMDKQGRFFVNTVEALLAYQDALPVMLPSSVALPSLFVDGHLAFSADVVFPVVHGPLYEDGALQGALELADIAYVGSDVMPSAIGMDKDMTRRVACVHGLACARYRSVSWHASETQIKHFCEQVALEFGFPLFVKPCSMGSSVGIHKAKTMDELISAVHDAKRYDRLVLVEEFIEGREIELAVLENISPVLKPHVSLPGEIEVHHQDGFYSYAAKYLNSEQSDLMIPAKLDALCVQQLQEAAADVFTRLRCRGMARVDFFVNDKTGKIYFNEINTLPGFTSISMYPKLWEASGLGYSDLLDRLINLATMHQQCRRQLVTHYQ